MGLNLAGVPAFVTNGMTFKVPCLEPNMAYSTGLE